MNEHLGASGSGGSAPVVILRRRPLSTRIACATPDLPFETSRCNSYKIQEREMKHLKSAFETLAKTPEKHLKTIANICNIQMKHLQTYV
jgi:hypothetical protein